MTPLNLLLLLVTTAFPTAAVDKTITLDGRERTFLVFVPSNPKSPIPVVLALHGGGGKARQMERYTRFNEVAEREGLLVVYPEAFEGNWNDGRGVDFLTAQREGIDDVKFVRAILDDVDKSQQIDRSRVFVTGISNGAILAHRLAADASDVITAIAPVVGGMAPLVAEKFDPKFPVSILIIQGDADPLVPIGGGEVGFPRGRKRGKVIATERTLGLYLKRNDNKGEPTKTMLDADPDDGTTTVVTKYPDGFGGVKTHFYFVKHGGHSWPGRPLYLPESVIGKASQDFSATEVIGTFFKSCPPRKLN